jgi:hypothetical protein
MNIRFNTILTFGILFQAIVFGITPNQTDNFQVGTTQGWVSGPLNPNQPSVFPGGFGGGNDLFLRVISNGGMGVGGKLVIMNSTQWTGDYIGTNITSISMRVRNSGANLLLLRLAFNGPSGFFCTATPVQLNTGGTWQVITFPILAADLTGTGSANATLSGVTEMRILHNSIADYHGDVVIGQLDVDDITAISNPLSVNDGNSLPQIFKLMQNYPNPFNPATIISFSVPTVSHVSLKVYSITGKEIANLVNEVEKPGVYSVYFDAVVYGLSSGVYFYQIKAGSYAATKKFILLK